MKNFLPILLLFLVGSVAAQVTKRDIDTELLSAIISEKQNEIKQRVLSDLVVNNIQTSNYVVYNTIYNLVNIVTTEKNKTVMKRDLIQQMADYAVAYGLAMYFFEHNLEVSIEDFSRTKDSMETDMVFGGSVEVYKEQEKVVYEDKMQFLMFNYILDEIYKKLTVHPYLTSKGLYKKDPFRNYFTTGLNVDYRRITQDRTITTSIDSQLNTFLFDINGYSSDLDAVFQFINSDALDLKDMRNVQSDDLIVLLSLFEYSIGEFRAQVGKNSFIATIGDIITKYVILEVEETEIYNFEIDVEAIILSLEDRFFNAQQSPLRKYNIGLKPMFTLGLNYGFFTNSDNQFYLNDPNTPESLAQIALGSEKLGVKFLVADYKYRNSHAPMDWFQYKGEYTRWTAPQKTPVISNIHGLVYISGMLYNVVNLKSEENFNYPIVGGGLGVEFFNGLQFNTTLSVPIITDESIQDKTFINFGFDIPLFTYLQELRSRN